jgi:hypothetical protein
MLRLSGKGVTARGTKPKALGRRTGVRNDLRLMNYKCNRIWVRRDEAQSRRLWAGGLELEMI